MSIRDNRFNSANPYARKVSQEWELAGLARIDGDNIAERAHTYRARKYEELARDWELGREG